MEKPDRLIVTAQFDEPLCSHPVATLLQCSQQYQEDQVSAQQLKETTLRDRLKKGQKEVNVRAIQVRHGYRQWASPYQH